GTSGEDSLARGSTWYTPINNGEFDSCPGGVMTQTLRWTSADLEVFPDDGKRREIIDGELFVSKAPSWEHQWTLSELLGELRQWNRLTSLGVVNAGPGLI